LGSGYWKYIPGSSGTRFITWYDYRTRFGIIGRIVDRVFFRPLLGWATAWSFDRLRLWLEKGILPEVSRDRAFVYALSRLMIAFVWLYHGLIPKLIYRNADELSMLRHAGIPIRIYAKPCQLWVLSRSASLLHSLFSGSPAGRSGSQ